MIQKIFFTVLMSFLLTGLYAQEAQKQEEQKEETKKEETKGVSPEIRAKVNKAKDRLLVEFGLNQLINRPDDVKFSGFSRSFNAYFTYDVVLGKSNFSIAPGAGIGTDNFYHKKNGIAWADNTHLKDTITSFPLLADSVAAKKSKLGLVHFDIPIEFRFRSKPNKKQASWKLAAGVKFGFLIGSKWKYKGEDLTTGAGEVKFKEIQVDNLNKFRYSVYLRGGYGVFNLFVNYQLSSVFQKDKGPQMHPLQFGIAICGL
jgi:hypothetical protein